MWGGPSQYPQNLITEWAAAYFPKAWGWPQTKSWGWYCLWGWSCFGFLTSSVVPVWGVQYASLSLPDIIYFLAETWDGVHRWSGGAPVVFGLALEAGTGFRLCSELLTALSSTYRARDCTVLCFWALGSVLRTAWLRERKQVDTTWAGGSSRSPALPGTRGDCSLWNMVC